MAQRNKITNGAAILARREELGVSQREMAERCGITASYLSRIEAGVEKPRRTSAAVQALAEHLNTSLDNITVAVPVAVTLSQPSYTAHVFDCCGGNLASGHNYPCPATHGESATA